MTLAIRNYTAIASQMVAGLAAVARDRLTDFTEGAVARSIVEVVADEIQRVEVSLFQGVRDGMAAGTFRSFDFGKQPAVQASGLVRYSRDLVGVPVVIPAGHQVQVPGSADRVYEVTVETLLDGAFVDVPVRCLTAGVVGNTASDTVVTTVTLINGVDRVSNPEPFLNGLNQESDEDRLLRFRRYIAGLSRATRVALEAAVLAVVRRDDNDEPVERVTGVHVRESFLETPAGQHGLVEVYVDNGAGTASEELLDQVLRELRGYRDLLTGARVPGWVAAGIDLRVYGVTPIPLDVVAQVTLAAGTEASAVIAAVQVAIEQYLTSLQVFQPAVFAELVAAAMGVDGVVDIAFTTPTANTVSAYDRRVVPGTVTITVAGGS